MRVKAALLRKFGPLPAWAWLAVFTAALVVYRRFHNPSGSSVTVPGNSGPATGTGAASGLYGAADGGGAGDLQPSSQTLGDLTGPGTPVVYDPTGGGTGGGSPGPVNPGDVNKALGYPFAAQASPPRIPPRTIPPSQGKPAPVQHASKPKRSRVAKPKPAPELVSEHGKGGGSGSARPPATRAQRAAKPRQKQTNQAPARSAVHTTSTIGATARRAGGGSPIPPWPSPSPPVGINSIQYPTAAPANSGAALKSGFRPWAK